MKVDEAASLCSCAAGSALEGPGSACWRAKGLVTLISCTAGTGAGTDGCTWAGSVELGGFGRRAYCITEARLRVACVGGCTWAGSVELGGFGQRSYCMAGGALLALVFLAGGGTHSSLFASDIGPIKAVSANSS